jgi:CheY-like chemotaxis protein
MKCPKCDGSFNATPDAEGLFHCPRCGAKLRSRPPGAGAPPPTPAGAPGENGLERVLAEIRALRATQEEILALLRSQPARVPSVTADAAGHEGDEDARPAPPLPTMRARRAKNVLVVDDQDETREAAVQALEQAQVPTRAVPDGSRGLEALAAERPDVIILELGISGGMAGKDVINMIKATMEWIDIPIVLWTRLPIESQKEARTVHGADEVVRKGPGAAETLVARVIQLFRRG